MKQEISEVKIPSRKGDSLHVNESLYESLVSVNEERKVNRNFLGLYRA